VTRFAGVSSSWGATAFTCNPGRRQRRGRNQHIHACPWPTGSAVLRSRESP
jgi:hypothetical protein